MAYKIADEPDKTSLGHLVVRPSMVLLGLMLGGAWIAFPWFVVNAFALGSPTRKRETMLAAGAFAGSFVIALAGAMLLVWLDIPRPAWKYLILVVIVWKLGMGYWISMLQGRTFPIYEHYGGQVRNAMPILGAGFVGRVVLIVFASDFWWTVIG